MPHEIRQSRCRSVHGSRDGVVFECTAPGQSVGSAAVPPNGFQIDAAGPALQSPFDNDSQVARWFTVGSQFNRVLLLEIPSIRQCDADKGIPCIILDVAQVSGIPCSQQRTGPGIPSRI
ncbi:hypothetical protein [Methylibium sp. T29]|uniref:hypothetical protein n=1 Tax=Methylibium sp. T29 TaxID=1430884 RepID=UPI0012683175|nr:hypothetical protein [Methylibium sp. T29]